MREPPETRPIRKIVQMSVSSETISSTRPRLRQFLDTKGIL